MFMFVLFLHIFRYIFSNVPSLYDITVLFLRIDNCIALIPSVLDITVLVLIIIDNCIALVPSLHDITVLVLYYC